MKILLINKFLHPNGGSETYVFKLGAYLESQGNEVEYFGMEHEGRCVGNRLNVYTSEMDFHKSSLLQKITYAVKTIYSMEARKKIRMVLDDFQPDICHINNFNYQLTPSIILEIQKWKTQHRRTCRIIYTAHDGQLVCPNHMMRNPVTHQNCEKCLTGSFLNCVKNKCIHGSAIKSLTGTVEAFFWNKYGVYKYIDAIICCSEFMKTKLDCNPVLASKTITLHNFVETPEKKGVVKNNYVLYFGRYSEEKGVDLLADTCRQLPDIPFVFAGAGPLESLVNDVENIKNVGFLEGPQLEKVIQGARFSVCPSRWYENCPFSVMESQMYGTPVIGADIGGIPELIQAGKTGELFEAGNIEDLKRKILELWSNKSRMALYSENCSCIQFDRIHEYYNKLIKLYTGKD